MHTESTLFTHDQFVDSMHRTNAEMSLAQALYYSRAERYGIAVRTWAELSIDVRRTYIADAQAYLDSRRPAVVLEMAQRA